MADSRTNRLRALHASGTFVIPNPFDPGSARLMAALGFEALATTSSGMAMSFGQLDMSVTRDQLLGHVEAMASATDLPLHVDSERCFADDAAGVAETVRLLGEAGAAGCSIEDWDPVAGVIDPVEVSVERVAAAVQGASASGLVVTARCEQHLRGGDDLNDTIARLVAYRDAGAEVVFAPGRHDLAAIERMVLGAGAPVNVLLLDGGPSADELAAAGVRRISLGGGLARTAYGAAVAMAIAVRDDGRLDPDRPAVPNDLLADAFRTRPAEGP